MKRALITGITGQDGSFLAENLLAAGYVVRGLTRRSPAHSLGPAEDLRTKIEIVSGDLADGRWVESQTAEFVPTEVYHLAFPKRIPVRLTGSQPAELFAAHAVGNLLTACERCAPNAKFLNVVGYDCLDSSKGPQGDDRHFQPHSIESALRLQTVASVEYFRNRRGLFAVSAFVFPHFSTRTNPASAPKQIARLAAKAGLGIPVHSNRTIEDNWSEFGYAPDYVVAFQKLLQSNTPADVILGTGVVHRMSEFARRCFDFVGKCPDGFLRIAHRLSAVGGRENSEPFQTSHTPQILPTADAFQIAQKLVESEIAGLRRDLRRGWHRLERAA